MKIISNEYNANLPMNKWPTKGGPAKFANIFSKLLIKRGHQWVGVVDVYRGNVIKSELITEKKNKWWRVINIPNKYFSKKFTKVKKYKKPIDSGAFLIEKISQVLSQEKPDLVFINGNSCFAWTLLRAAKKLNLPTIVLHAGIWGLEIDLYSDYFSKVGVKIMKEMEKDFASLADSNVFLNETSKKYFIKNIYKIKSEKIEIIPLPCDKIKTTKIKGKYLTKNINVGIVARWDRIKNHQAFLLVAQELKKINANYNFYSVTSIPTTKHNKAFKKEYQQNINVLSPMDQKKLNVFYKKMSFMILPSIFDVSPHVVLESAFNGITTFISNGVGYAKLFVDNNLENLIIDFSNPKKAAQKINKYKDKRYPLAFIAKLKNMHSKDNVVKSFEKLFKKIAYENRSTSIKS